MGDGNNPVYLDVKTPELDWNAPDKISEWEYFESRCKLIFGGPWKNMPEEEKAANFQLWVGKRGYEFIKTWKLTATQSKKCNEFYTRFALYFEPKSNFRLARYQMSDMFQQSGETVDQFMARVKLQAIQCKFDDAEYESRLIEQLIKGTNNDKVQEAVTQHNGSSAIYFMFIRDDIKSFGKISIFS